MKIRNFSHVSLNFLDQLRHGRVVVQVLLFLFRAHFCAAQIRQAPPFFDPLPPQPKFNPSLALLMLIIVGAFFCLGFLSIYIRRCTERRYMGGRLGVNSPALGGGLRFSRRGQQGLDADVIGTFPTFLYSMVKGHKIGKAALECAVCLNEFEDDETLRLIPKCSHVFHPDCIDAWLASHTTCPVCRADLVPKPDDIPFDSNSLFEPDAQNEIQIQVSNENGGQNRGSEVVPNRPPRSWSTGWRLFPKSRSIRLGESVERFTLRLPEEIRDQLLNSHLNRTKSCVAFPRATSSRRGYRSRSGGSWRRKNYYYYERFDQEQQQQQPSDQILHRTKNGSVRLSNGEMNNAKQPKSFLKSVKSIKSPFDRFYGVDRNGSKKDTTETSLDKLRPDGDSELV